jgi:hypothetical protein
LQNRSKEILIFGGIIDHTKQYFSKYLNSIISLFHNKEVKCTVINFIRPEIYNENIYITVSIFKKLMDLYPNKLTYSVYNITNSLPMPTAYHIYDNQYIQFIMRGYIPQRDSMNAVSSFMIKSQKICNYYHNEIVENYKKLGRLDNSKYKLFVQNLNIDQQKMKKCKKAIEQFLQERY